MSRERTVLCIVGPTASGKTSLSVGIAQQLNGEIISADAVSVYRGLDIGSAKPTLSERQGIPHHLIDCADLTDSSFSVSVFRVLAREAIDSVLAAGHLPIVIGGSGLYVDSIFSDMRFSAPSDPAIRAELEEEYESDPNAFFARLRCADPVTANRLHPNDKKRIVRAGEVMRITGQPFSALNHDFETAQRNDGTYHPVKVGLCLPREELYRRIDLRVDQMMRDGLKAEAYSLFDRGLTPDRCTGMHSIGYTQLYDVYCGKCSEYEAVEAIKLATRHFAKRQMTWFRRDTSIVWYDVQSEDVTSIIQRITELLCSNRS